MRTLTCSVLMLGVAGTTAIAQETTTYSYDVHGRLITAERSTGADTAYAYDDGNSRTSKVTTGGSLLMTEPDAEAEAVEAGETEASKDANTSDPAT
jgi:YD repeat-containing protein